MANKRDGIELNDAQKEELVIAIERLDSGEIFALLRHMARVIIRRRDDRSSAAVFVRGVLERMMKEIDDDQIRRGHRPAGGG